MIEAAPPTKKPGQQQGGSGEGVNEAAVDTGCGGEIEAAPSRKKQRKPLGGAGDFGKQQRRKANLGG